MIYRKDRDILSSLKSSGGGVLAAVKKDIQSCMMPADTNMEVLFISLPLHKTILSCAYIPPGQQTSTYDGYCDLVNDLASSTSFSSLILAGDFNIATYDIANCPMNAAVRAKTLALQDLANLHSLVQINHVRNSRNVSLDLVFSSEHSIAVGRAEDPLLQADSHHPPLSFTMPVGRIEQAQHHHTRPNLHKCNLNAASEKLRACDFGFIYNKTDINERFSRLICMLGDISVQCSPVKRMGCSPFPKWFTKDLIQLVIRKKSAHKRYKSTQSPTDYFTFSTLRKQCKDLSRICYQEYLNRVENCLSENPRSFWKFVHSSKDASAFPSTLTFNGSSSTDPDNIARLFSEFFASVYSEPVASHPPSFSFDSVTTLRHFHFTTSEVLESLKRLDPNKGPGPDNIPPSLLKHACDLLSDPLRCLFNDSLQCGQFPEVLKMGHITPILKAGNPSEIRNYRPITILSSVGKVFEYLVLSRLKPFLKNVINPYQHGFTPGRSTVTNLLLFEDYILDSMSRGKQVDVAFVDFAKAFDKVDHSILVSKLQAYGVMDPVLSWLRDYLAGRRLRVKIPGAISVEFDQTSGVPQGSLLGPYLFNAFINDIIDVIKVNVLMFADDVKIFLEVSNEEDSALLQSSLDALYVWCNSNNMALNISKCHIMTFYRARMRSEFDYTIDGQRLESLNMIKDLGVIFTSNLSFEKHIDRLCGNANKMLGLIMRTTRGLNTPALLRTLYCSLIRQALEYASPVWSPYLLGQMARLEAVQKKFLRLVGVRQGLPFRDVPVQDLQHDLHLPDLETRRCVSDVIFLSKLVTGLLDCPELLYEIDLRVPSSRTRSRHLFGRRQCSRDYEYNSPLIRMLRLGNNICQEVDFFHDSIPTIRRKTLARLFLD